MKIIVTQTIDGREIGLGPFEDHIAERVVVGLRAQNPRLEVSAIEYVTTDEMGIYL